MNVRLLYFAVLRDITGSTRTELELAEGATPRIVWNSMRTQHPALAAWTAPPMVAINEEYASPDTPLHDGDELAFIPPVAGG